MVAPDCLVLGAAQWGARYGIANTTGPPTDDELRSMLSEASAAGVGTIDTARAYPGSEARIGAVLGGAESWRIVTKVSPDLDAVEVTAVEAFVRRSLDESRRALARDRLDAVLLHREEHRNAFDGRAWDVLRAERDAGRIHAIGLSVRDVSNAERFLGDPSIEIVQVPGNIIDRRLYDRGFFTAASDAGKEVLLRSVFLQGALLLPIEEIPPFLAELRPSLAMVDDWVEPRGMGRYEACLSFAALCPGVKVVVGCETTSQVRRLLEGWARVTDPDASGEWRDLWTALPSGDDDVLDPWRWLSVGRPGGK